MLRAILREIDHLAGPGAHDKDRKAPLRGEPNIELSLFSTRKLDEPERVAHRVDQVTQPNLLRRSSSHVHESFASSFDEVHGIAHLRVEGELSGREMDGGLGAFRRIGYAIFHGLTSSVRWTLQVRSRIAQVVTTPARSAFPARHPAGNDGEAPYASGYARSRPEHKGHVRDAERFWNGTAEKEGFSR